MDQAELRERLRRLGLSQGTGALKLPQRPRGAPLEEVLPGEVVYTDLGAFFSCRTTYAGDYHHGHNRLTDLAVHGLEHPARLARDERLAKVDLERVAFVDTETTGLAGGTGTYVFLVGVGLFVGEQFTVHQFFMRDFHEEPALLLELGRLLDGMEAVVSFNGKAFDLPLLETRFLLARQSPRLTGAPHLDLLPVARRFWKYRLASCALSSLETHVLGIERTQEDVPGWLIPELYLRYVRSGEAREMPRIFYHNAQDILSLVALTVQLCNLLAGTEPPIARQPGEDLYSLGRFLQETGQPTGAEAAYRQAIERSHSSLVLAMTMRDLAYLLRRQGRRSEALPLWESLAERDGAVYACEELAKHYEWHGENPREAAVWTGKAIDLVARWPPGRLRHETELALQHRLRRLESKRARDIEGKAP
jgi:uncharacterized protein